MMQKKLMQQKWGVGVAYEIEEVDAVEVGCGCGRRSRRCSRRK